MVIIGEQEFILEDHWNFMIVKMILLKGDTIILNDIHFGVMCISNLTHFDITWKYASLAVIQIRKSRRQYS